MPSKQNDWLATLLYQPEMSIEDLNTAGITPDNTSLKDRDFYKNVPAVKNAFSENGKFDERKFNNFYDSALLLYNDYANKETLGNLEKNYKYDPFDWRYDGKKADATPTLSFGKNPMGYSTSIKAADIITPQQLSIREIAQTNRVYDYENDQWLDWTPNEKGGFLKALFRENLVLATYDKDEDVLEDGRMVHHSKGEYKFDPITGKPFYETLGNREIYDKDVLRYSDTLTREGTTINKWDFFDSDGLDKSVGGTLMKLTARIAPTALYFVAPEIGLVYGGISAAMALSQLMPTLGKAVDGLFTNDVLDNEIGRKLNKFEAATARFSRTQSDRSREKIITMENAASLIGDVAMQLFQQRAVQYIPRLFKNNPSLYNNADLAKTLSYAYMSGISALESYSAFKQAGADDRTAGLGMIATTAAFYKLMSINYFRDSFFRGSWFDDNNVKSPVWDVAKDFMEVIKKESAEGAAQETTKTAARTLKSLTKAFTDAIRRTGRPWRPQVFWERTFAEGAEEVMEEVMQDAIKGAFKGAEALGLDMTKEQEKLDFGFSPQDAMQRYGMSLVGGLVGGAIFQGYNNLEMRRFNAKTPEGILHEAHLSELVKLISDGRGSEIRKLLNGWHKNQRFGSNALSGTKLSMVGNFEGDSTVAEAKADGEMSQNDFIYQLLMDQVDYVEDVLGQEGFKNYKSKTLETIKKLSPEGAENINERQIKFEELGLHTLFYNDLNRLATKIVDLRSKIDTKKQSYGKEPDTAEGKKEYQDKVRADQSIKDYEDELKNLRKLRDGMFNGDWNDYYVSQYKLLLDSEPLLPFLGFSDENSFIRARYGKNATELTAAQLEIAKSEYESYKNGDKASVFSAIDVYRSIAEEFAAEIAKAERNLGNSSSDTELNTSIIGNAYFDIVKSRDDLQNELNKLREKETLTDEETARIDELTTKIDSKNAELESYKRRPQRMLYNQSDSDSLIEQLVQVLNQTPESVDPFLIQELGTKVVNAYQDWNSNKILKRNQSELAAFLELVVRQSLTKAERDHEIGEFLMDVGSEMGLAEDDGLFSGLVHESPSDIQRQVFSLVDDFYMNLSTANVAGALQSFSDLEELLKANGMTPEDMEGLWQTLKFDITGELLPDLLKKIASEQEKLKTSATTDLLKKLTSRINDEVVSNIIDMLQAEQQRLASASNLDYYTISTRNVREGLLTARVMLEALKGELLGASNGTNAEINKYRENKFAEISSNAAIMLAEELDEYINRIKFLLQLDAYNSGSKLREHKEIAVNMRIKFFEKLIDKIHSEPFNDIFGFDPAEIWEDMKPTGFDYINSENYPNYEAAIIAFETELFNKIQEKGLSGEGIVEGILGLFGEGTEIWKGVSTKMTKDSEEQISDYDFAYYLLSVLTLNSNDFFVKLKEVDEKLDKVPLYGHDYVLRTAYAYLRNIDTFNLLLDSIADTYKGSDEYIKSKYSLKNILFGFGGAGVGKSTSIAKIFKELCSDLDADIIYLASGKDQLDVLTSAVGASDTDSKLTYSQFTSELVEEQLLPKNLQIDDNDRVVTKAPITLNDKSWHDSSKRVKIIIADEVETQNELELQVLSEYAQREGAFVLALGDYNQPTAKITIDGKTYGSGIEDCNIVKTPMLFATLRALSVAKVDNANLLLTLVNSISERKISDPEHLDPTVLNGYVDELTKKPTELHYYEQGDRIVGDRVLQSSDEFTKQLDKALAVGGSTKVLIVTDSSTESKYQSDKYKSFCKNVQQALGGEYDYVFVDIGHDWSDKASELQTLYMLTQRSRLYTAVLDSEDQIKSNLNIVTKLDLTSDGLMQIGEDVLSDFKEWRLKGLEGLAYSENAKENLGIEVVETPEEPLVKAEHTKKPIEEKSEEPETDEETDDDSEDDDSEEAESEDDEEPTPKRPTPPPTTPKKPHKVSIKSAPEPKTNTDASVSEIFKEEETEEPMDMITSVSPTFGSIRFENYFNQIYSRSFIAAEQSNKNSMWNVLKGTRYLDQIYSDLVATTSMSIFRASDAKAGVTYAFRYIENRYGEMLGTALDKLRPYISSTSNAEIRLAAKSKGSDIILRLNAVNGNYIEIKIGESSIRKNGIYTGWFTKTSNVGYTDGERLTLKQLKAKYPALSLNSAIGILIGGEAANYSGSEEFAERNDGKSFLAIGELIDELSENDIFRAARSGDKMWTYAHSDVLRLAGIQKIMTPEDVCKYLVFRDFIYREKLGDEEKYNYIKQRRLANLAQFGVVSNGTVDRNAVLNGLAEITGNDLWLRFDSDSNPLTDEQKKSMLYGPESYIGTDSSLGYTIAEILADVINKPGDYSGESSNGIFYALRYLLCGNVDDRRLFIQTKDGRTYYIKADKANDREISRHWELIEYETGRSVGKSDSVTTAVGSQLGVVLGKLLQNAGITLEGGKALFLRNVDDVWKKHNTNEALHDLLSPFISNANKRDWLFSKLKHGFYANIRGVRKANDGPWKLASLDEKALEKYTTRATNWHYSTYSLDESQVQEDGTAIDADNLKVFKDGVTSIKNEATKLVESSIIDQILVNHNKVSFESATDAVNELQEIIQDINDHLFATTTNIRTKGLSWSWTGEAELIMLDSKDAAVNNLLYAAGFDLENSEFFINFDNGIGVVADGKNAAYVYAENDGEVVVKLTAASTEYVSALQTIWDSLPKEYEGDRDINGYVRGLVLDYMYNFIKNTVTLDQANRFWTYFSNNNPEVLDAVNKFIEKRLNNEIDEC